MARFLLNASGGSSLDLKELRKQCKGLAPNLEIKITSVKKDQVFTGQKLVVMSAKNKRGASKVQDVLWDYFGCGCVEIDTLPDKGFGGRRMGAELPINSYMD